MLSKRQLVSPGEFVEQDVFIDERVEPFSAGNRCIHVSNTTQTTHRKENVSNSTEAKQKKEQRRPRIVVEEAWLVRVKRYIQKHGFQIKQRWLAFWTPTRRKRMEYVFIMIISMLVYMLAKLLNGWASDMVEGIGFATGVAGFYEIFSNIREDNGDRKSQNEDNR